MGESLATLAAAKTGLEKFVATATRAEAEVEAVEVDAAAPVAGRTSQQTAAEDSLNAWPDDSAESAFLGDARARGETVTPASAAVRAAAEETEPKGALPPLSELMNRIPTEVRDVLDELFRAKFVTVKRVPKKALKV